MTREPERAPAESRRWVWLAWSVVAALPVWWLTFIGSVGISCGAYDHGPNPGAEERFCGFASGEPRDYSLAFHLVQLIPTLPLLVTGLMVARGAPRRLLVLGAVGSAAAMALVWSLEP